MPASGGGGGGGSFDPVGMLLARNAVSLKGVAAHSLAFNTAYDNPYDFGAISSVPAGLGITLSIDGSSATMLTTTAGVWYLELRAGLAYDATYQGVVGFGFGAYGDVWVPAVVGVGNTAECQASTIADLPTAAQLAFSVTTQVDATAVAYAPNFVGTIVRLA